MSQQKALSEVKMNATKTKVAYTLFLISFSIWLVLFGTALFPAIATGSQIQFPDPAIQTLFLGTTVTSSIGCLLISADFLLFRMDLTKQKGH